MRILLSAGLLVVAANACYNIPTTPYDQLISINVDGQGKIATKVDLGASLADLRSCLYNSISNIQFFLNQSQPIQQLDENYTYINQTISYQMERNLTTGQDNQVRVVYATTAPQILLVYNDSTGLYVNVFDSFTLAQLRASAYLDYYTQFAYGGSPIDINDEYSILIRDVEDNGAVYTYQSGNHSNHTNTTYNEDYYENVDVAGRINITDVPQDYSNNPANFSFDLGKQWYFSNFSIILGIFDYNSSWVLDSYFNALYPLGINLIYTYDEQSFLNYLNDPNVVQAHIISGANWTYNYSGDQYSFTWQVINFIQAGKGVLFWGNPNMYNFHSNVVLGSFYAGQNTRGDSIYFQFSDITTWGGSLLTPGPYSWPYTQEFFPHKITTGINNFYEGGFNLTRISSNASSYPWDQFGDFVVVANSSDGYPVILALNRTSCGRVIIDNGITRLRNQTFNQTTGNARLLRNEAVWLSFNDFQTNSSQSNHYQQSLEDYIISMLDEQEEEGFLTSY